MAQTETEILEELREQFDYGEKEWQDTRERGDTSMRAMGGDVWDPEERKEREEKNRPCLSLDELSQYSNQLINDIRSSKRGIVVTPKGTGADDKSAELRQGLMRQIEYESNAQQDAYIVMAENAIQRSYGFLRIMAEYTSDRSFEQALLLAPIPDPNTVTIDPDILRADGKDMLWAFQKESWSQRRFKRELGELATITNFSGEVQKRVGSKWLSGDRITLANYWRIEKERQKLIMVQLPNAKPLNLYDSELTDVLEQLQISELPKDAIVKTRWVDVPHVRQYLTNGVELLYPKDQKTAYTELPGKSIPIVPCFGKIMYLRENGETKRVILSLPALALDAAMLYCYYRTQQAEMAGMIPKAPVVGYVGQFRGREDAWEASPHEPFAFLEVHPRTESTGAQILPLPQRIAYEAGEHLQALELCAEGARRAVQAAMGIAPLPTVAQRQNEKSGVALDKIDSAEQKGSFHFVDHYNASITRAAQILEEWIPTYYDTARDVTVRQPDDSPKRVRINDPQAQGGHLPVEQADHDVTLSTGPSFESQRDAASDFINTLAQNEMFAPKIIDLLTKLKNLGPIGDEMAARLTPPEFQKMPGMEELPPQVRTMLGQAQQKIQQLEQQASLMADEIKTEAVKAQAAKDLKKMDLDFQRSKLERDSETKITVAELSAKVDRLQLFLEERERLGLQIKAALDTLHDSEEQSRNRAHDVGQTVLDHTLQKDRADQAQAHTLEQSQQGHAQAIEQQQLAQPAVPDDASA